ncbi:MAG TPA: hypothetical protein DFR83_16155 [Deltaproteobacteria bacterium]|nr:hypothetical protein [Deltaproteobacteria bacterium]
MTLHGTLRFHDLGSGSWSLKADDGEVYDLDVGAIRPNQLRGLHGHKVSIEGRSGGVGFGMTGAHSFVVTTITHTH